MDIGSFSMINSSSLLQSTVGFAMLGKALDTNSQQGNAVAQMIDSVPTTQQMEQSANPAVGSIIDLSV